MRLAYTNFSLLSLLDGTRAVQSCQSKTRQVSVISLQQNFFCYQDKRNLLLFQKKYFILQFTITTAEKNYLTSNV